MDRTKGIAVTDWFIHDPAEGRIGPLTVDDLRSRYRQRRIQRDTLVWHAGMREWQPLDRVSDQVGIDDIVQDTTLPPPLPSMAAARPVHASAAAYPSAHARHAPPSKAGMSGCAIVAIVLAVLAIPFFGIVAAIALPAYQDYVERSRAAQGSPAERPFDEDRLEAADALARDLIEVAVLALPAGQVQCPADFELERAMVRHPRLQGSADDGWANVVLLEEMGNRCAYEVTYRGVGGIAEGKSARHDVVLASDPLTVTCRNLTLPPDHLPPGCSP